MPKLTIEIGETPTDSRVLLDDVPLGAVDAIATTLTFDAVKTAIRIYAVDGNKEARDKLRAMKNVTLEEIHL